jgi:hypothetical protein
MMKMRIPLGHLVLTLDFCKGYIRGWLVLPNTTRPIHFLFGASDNQTLLRTFARYSTKTRPAQFPPYQREDNQQFLGLLRARRLYVLK